MSENFMPDDDHDNHDDQPQDDSVTDEVSYEAFDDVLWQDAAEEPDVIDLDALDEAIVEEDATPPAAPDRATQGLFDTLETLDDDIGSSTASPPVRTGLPRPASRPPVVAPSSDEPKPPARTALPTRPPASANTPPPVPTLPKAAPAALVAPTDEGEDTTGDSAETAPVAVEMVYEVLLGVPPKLGAQVLELRATGDIADMAPPGIALTAPFRASDALAVESALEDWAADYLPFTVTLNGVLAEVVGTDQYVAAWALQPENDLRVAQRDLAQTLASLITAEPGASSAFQVRLTIGERIAARRYPHVIAQMQRDFEPFSWDAEELLLVRRRADAAPDEWEIARPFAG